MTSEELAALVATKEMPRPAVGLAGLSSRGKLTSPPAPLYFKDPHPDTPVPSGLTVDSQHVAPLAAKPLSFWERQRQAVFNSGSKDKD